MVEEEGGVVTQGALTALTAPMEKEGAEGEDADGEGVEVQVRMGCIGGDSGRSNGSHNKVRGRARGHGRRGSEGSGKAGR